MIKLTINDRDVEVEEGITVLQACEKLGIEIPRFCYHDRLSIAGSCRMCLVQVEKMPRLMPSCALPCTAGMNVQTDNDVVKRARQSVMEMLLVNHPLDCPVCDQGGECDLQDEAFAYGADRCRSKEPRRQVRDKDLGPLIKTVMTRCIHCTRCIRFMDEIAGSPELGAFACGEKTEIAPLHEGPLLSELSGNLVDVCPVGALTSKPYAFKARPWELEHTDSIDVMDAVGSNIRIDSRGGQVMRIVPRENKAINDVWIHDKTRFSCDGLALQRLDMPYIRHEDGRLYPASWPEALDFVGNYVSDIAPERMAVLAGDMVDCESLFAMKSLLDKMDVPHRDCRQDGANYDVRCRAGYVMNSLIAGIDQADAILLVGTNPRHEAPLINARIYKRWRQGGLAVGMIGAPADLGYPCTQVGHSPVVLRDFVEGKVPFAKTLKRAKNPMLILGAGALARMDGAAIHGMAREIAEACGLIREDWNGFNVLQLAAARTGALDVGFLPHGTHSMATRSILAAAMGNRLDLLYLMGADEIDMKRLGKTFVIYQGHHGDRGAERADVVLPTPAYTEKNGTYVNTEGRVQRAAQAVPPPFGAREDWSVLTDVAQAAGYGVSFKSFDDVRRAMIAAVPHLGQVGEAPMNAWKMFGSDGTLSLNPFTPAVPNYYMTDPISRCSPTMAACAQEIWPLIRPEGGEA
ncbi:MAG: NADH-quinone oxidoreductase subunit G [Proteobacteria bacterium]|nr:NADH-quinone oxidoreductase subunit G [Pseudomonadota bacterium]